MAPSSSKPSTKTSIQELLVANKKATEKSWNKKLQYPLFHASSEFYFIDGMDCYEDVLTKMGSFCKKPISRIFYVDSDSDEVPIDSEVEMKEAIKLITERTDRGKFTKMRLETGNGNDGNSKKPDGERKHRATKAVKQAKPKKVSPKPKSAPIRIISKPAKCDDVTETWKTETASSMPQKTPIEYVANVSESKLEPGVSQAWMESKLKEFKVELLDDLKSFLAPYIQDQMKIKTLVGLVATQVAAPTGAMSLPELDHNYSAPSYCDMVNRTEILPEKENLMKSNHQTSAMNPEQHKDGVQCLIESCDECTAECSTECTAQCSFNQDEDENLSILSGEISVTDSESDVEGMDDDFVDIPLPPCFNVIEPKTGIKLNKLGKEAKPTKTGLEMKHWQTLETKTTFLSQDQTGSEQLFTKSVLKERKGQDQKTKECSVLETVEKSNECQNSFMEKLNRSPSDDETEENLEDVGSGGGQGIDKSYGEKYNFYTTEQQCVKGKSMPSPSNDHQAGPEHTKKTGLAPKVGVPEHYDNFFQNAQQKYVAPVVDITFAPPCAPLMSNAPLPSALPGYPLYTAKRAWYPPYLERQLQPTAPAVQQPTLATVIAQHQQIVLAAQRAGQPATQTIREFSNAQPSQQLNLLHRQQPMVSHLDNRPGNPSGAAAIQSENSCPSNSLTTESQGKKTNSYFDYCRQSGSCRKEELSQDQRFWHEIVQIDQALQKWVQVCKQFIELVPNRIDETSTMPESFRRSSATATQTCEDLDKLYQKFRKEVVSAQLDPSNLQGTGKSSFEDGIHILPTKLLDIVSSTVNTTFNILGNISKLGMMNAPTSAPSDRRSASFTGDKSSLSRVSSSYSPSHNISSLSSLATSLGNMRLAASQYMPYPYMGPIAPATETQSSMSFDFMNNQDYRMRPAGVTSSLNAQYPHLLSQNMSFYPSSHTIGQTPARTNVQAPSQPPQPHTQTTMTRQVPYLSSQLIRPVTSQLPQQLFPPVPHQFS